MFHCLSPFVRAETIKACVLNRLHLVAAAGGCGFSGSLSLDFETFGDTVAQKKSGLGQRRRIVVRKCRLSSSDFREHNVERFALHVIGLNWSGEQVPFCWKTGLSCHVALDMVCRKAFFEGIQES